MKQTHTNPIPRLRTVLALSLVIGVGASGFAQDDEDEEEIFELSPFEVTSTADDVGYRATNTLAGTRMNSRVADLAASISIVTKQQLEDTASTDINDVFMYEANTEGTHTYTAYSLNRGSIQESVQMTPTTANRVRGIGSPDRAVNYFVSISDIPFDAYNTERLAINRGPNSVLFGLGSAAGLVNVSPMRAQVDSDMHGQVEVRLGSYGDFRTSFNYGTPLIEGKLAIKVAGLHHDRGFRREPSHDETQRGFLTMTYKPLESLTFRGSYEHYESDYSRPNSTTPEDHISHWLAAGKPTYNPSTMEITHNGVTQTVSGASGGFNTEIGEKSGGGLRSHPHLTRPAFFIENGSIINRMQRQLSNTNVGGANQPEALMATAAPSFDSPLYGLPGVSNQEIYDWEDINVYSGNFGEDEAETLELSVEKQLFEDLFIEVAMRKEDFNRYSVNAQSGSQSGVYVDINETLLDGSPNPGFMKPYIETWEPSPGSSIQSRETVRATAAYTLDFTDSDGWTKWFGRHNLMGMGQKFESTVDGYRWREAALSTHDWSGDPSASKFTGPNAKRAWNRVYYLGDNVNITHAPGDVVMYAPGQTGADYPANIGHQWIHTLRGFVVTPDGDGNIRDGSTDWPVAGGRLMGNWVDEQVTGGLILHDAWRDVEEIESTAAVLQSYFWDDRIITTLGVRDDTRRATYMVGPDINEFGMRDNLIEGFGIQDPDEWDEVSGTTSTTGIVVKPFEWFSLHYNKSDTFRPAPIAQNLFLEELPNPTGEGEDYGFSLTFLEDKLVARVNWYEASESDSRSGIGLYTWRARRVENEGSWGLVDMVERDIERREGLAEGTLDAFSQDNSTTAPYIAEIAERSGLAAGFLQNSRGFEDTGDIVSEGMEISLDYNPIPNWNIKFTAARQQTINSDVAGSTQRWLWGDGTIFDPAAGSRLHFWQNAKFENDAGEVVDWWTTSWPGMPSWGNTPQAWYEGVVQAGLLLEMATDGTPQPQVREWRWAAISNYRFTDGALKGFGVGGSLRWEDEASIGNELLANPDGSGFLNLYDANKPIFDEANFYVDAWLSYRTSIWNDSVDLKFQLNVRDMFEDGGLQVIRANPDGSARGFRIVDPRTFYLSTTLSF